MMIPAVIRQRQGLRVPLDASHSLAGLALIFFLAPIAANAGSATSRPAVGTSVETARYRVTLSAADEVQEPMHKHLLWRYIFQAEDRTTSKVRLLEYPDNYGKYGNRLRWFGIEGDRLYVFRPLSIGVFLLATGKLAEDLAVSDPIVSPRDNAIAYSVRQLGYAGSERQGSIVAVLDLATAKRRYVFPEPKTITELRHDKAVVVMGPESDTDQQHDAKRIFWSPAGDRLAFLCAHGFKVHPAGRMYLVIVDLSGPSGSDFVHQPLSPQLYRKGGASDVAFNAESMTWVDRSTIEVRPEAKYSDKVRDRFVVKLPEVARP
jgi:hypothetical protein